MSVLLFVIEHPLFDGKYLRHDTSWGDLLFCAKYGYLRSGERGWENEAQLVATRYSPPGRVVVYDPKRGTTIRLKGTTQ
jgi:hypothetical protein